MHANTVVFRSPRAVISLGGAALAVAVMVHSAMAFPDHGRYLPESDLPGGNTINSWGNTGGPNQGTQFSGTVTDTPKGINAGQVKFDYDTYTLNPGGNSLGGAALSGGFFANPNVAVKEGFTLTWVQTVHATYSGDNEWNLPNQGAGWFPDGDPLDRQAPLGPNDTLQAPGYIYQEAAVHPAGDTPMLGFFDAPGRLFSEGNQFWLAELALTCISNTRNLDIGGTDYREVRVISSLLWGFNMENLPVAPPGQPGIGNITTSPPGLWGDATPTFLSTLNEFYDGTGGGGGDNGMGGTLFPLDSDLYHFENNSNCFRTVPEPATGLLCLLVFSAGLTRRSRIR